jgi:phosphopantothenoylcysteine decarboxylase/phosphopantothenate--cysteine ligase
MLVGFAAETQDLAAHAREKLAAKGLDLIAANDVSAPGVGFGSEENEVRLFAPEGELGVLAGSKEEVADRLWDHIALRVDR